MSCYNFIIDKPISFIGISIWIWQKIWIIACCIFETFSRNLTVFLPQFNKKNSEWRQCHCKCIFQFKSIDRPNIPPALRNCHVITLHFLFFFVAKLQFMVWAPWALGSGQDVLGSRVYWAPEITGLQRLLGSLGSQTGICSQSLKP